MVSALGYCLNSIAEAVERDSSGIYKPTPRDVFGRSPEPPAGVYAHLANRANIFDDRFARTLRRKPGEYHKDIGYRSRFEG